MESRVNILLSTYNGQEFLQEQIESLLGQSYKNIHIYIRDDGSTDDTKNILAQWKEDCRFTIIEGSNKGFCPSFYELLSMSDQGEYWAFCDQDDVWLPQKIRLAVEWFEQNNQKDIPVLYHAAFEFVSQEGNHLSFYELPKLKYNFARSLTSNVFFGFSMVINSKLRDMLLKCNCNNIKLHDWFAAMITTGFGVYYHNPEICAKHRIHETNSTPIDILKKIPLGVKLLSGENYYKKNAQEFYENFGEILDEEKKGVLSLFIDDKYSIKNTLKKVFYPHRWNHLFSVEIVTRLLMLIGKI